MTQLATTTEIRERPILFSGAMVRAILEGRKTQTRRICKQFHREYAAQAAWRDDEAQVRKYLLDAAPWRVGDRLWVREKHIVGFPVGEDGRTQSFDENGATLPLHCWYAADDPDERGYISNRGSPMVQWTDEDGGGVDSVPWRPSIHMPRWAARITLRVTGVRVERVQTISDADCLAEGMQPFLDGWDASPKIWWQGYDGRFRDRNGNRCHTQYPGGDQPPAWMENAERMEVSPIPLNVRGFFQDTWNRINGDGAWARNDWVWVIEFEREAVRQ